MRIDEMVCCPSAVRMKDGLLDFRAQGLYYLFKANCLREEGTMKAQRILAMLLTLAVLLAAVACGNGSFGTTLEAVHTAVPKSGIEVSLEDGEEFGCHFICYVNGMGYCYNAKDAAFDFEQCSLVIHDRITVSSEYFYKAQMPLYGYREECTTGYPISVRLGTEDYRLGLLLILKSSDQSPYGTGFEFISQSDPDADLKPCEPRHKHHEQLDRSIGGYLKELDTAEHRAEIQQVVLMTDEEGYTAIVSADKDTRELTLAPDAFYLVCSFDCNSAYMVVKDTAFQLLWDRGYAWIHEAPCFMAISDGTILGIIEVCNA